MNSIHDHIEDMMAAAITGGLSAEEQQSFDQHLAECPDCRKLYQEEKMTASLLDQTLSPDRPPMDFEERMVRRFRRDLLKQNVNGFERIYTAFSRFCRMPGISVVATAAMLAVLIVLGNLLSPATSHVRESARKNDGDMSYAGTTGVKEAQSSDQPLIFDNGGDGKNGTLEKRINETERKLKDTGYTGVKGSGIKISGYVDTSYTVNLADRDNSKALKPDDAKIPLTIEKDSQVSTKASNGRAFSLPGGSVTSPLISSEDAGNKQPPTSNASSVEPVPHFKFNEQTGSFVIDHFDYKEAGPNGPKYSKIPFLGDIPGLGELFAANKLEKGAPQEGKAASESVAAEPTASQKLIRNASLEFEIQNFESAQDRIRVIAGEESGYIATSNSARLSNGKVRGQIIVKVLPDHLDRLLLKLRALGDLKNQSIATQDVTKAYFDTEARMRNSKRMEDRLLKMLDEAKGKVTDLLVVEKELARVRQDIEEMQGQIKVYDALVAYATVTITMYEKDMNQPAAFLLKEHANLGLFSPDVEKTFRDAKSETESAKGQVIQSNMTRDNEGNASATLRVLVAPENSDALLATLKKMGRVQSLTWQNERVAQDGSGTSDTARVEKDKVEINLAIVHDDESRKQVTLAVVTKSVEDALDKAKAEAAAQKAEVLASSLERTPDGHAAAQFNARVPAKSYNAFLNSLKALGRVSQFTIQRNDQSAQAKESEDAPVLLSLGLTDQEPALQQTTLNVLTDGVETKSVDIKTSAASKGAEVQSSTFEHAPDGREVAVFSFRVPMNKYAGFVEYLKGLGQVKDFAVHRQDLPGATGGADAPAEITMQLFSKGNIVADDTGFFATIRKTLGEGMGALMWSVRMIGVALAYLFPWLIAVGVATLAIWLVRRRRR